jgi:hypothetical protein
MAHRRREMTNAVRDVVEQAGGTVIFGFTGSSHQVAEIVFGGQRRKIFLSSTPSDRNGFKSAARETRKLLAQLGATSIRTRTSRH